MMEREVIIRNYINAYNEYDIEKMMAHFDDNFVFENVTNGVVTLSLNGLAAFKEQAEKAKTYFSERRQEIKSIRYLNNEVEVQIEYKAILAIDLPNGLRKGDALQLQGKSVFTFRDNKIIALKDIS